MNDAQPLARAEVSGPRWRAEPYRFLFPLGALLAWAGVLHWLVLATGVWNEYRATFHAIAQIQGFLTSFAAGFLFTFIPRRTGAPPASRWQLAVAVLAPVATTAFAWREQWIASQGCWVVELVVLMIFALGRLRRAQGRGAVPPGFVWVPTALGGSLLAAILAGVGGATDRMWLHDLARSFIQQGLFTGLVLGIGSLLLPVLAYGKPPPPRPGRGALVFQLAAVVVYLASFLVEQLISTSAGFALRALATAAVLLRNGLWRWPTMKGLHRTLAWFAPWCLPVSAALVAIFPEYRKAALHVAFIGCFGLAALAVSIHVAVTHAGRAQLLEGGLWRVRSMALLLALALAGRVAVDLAPNHFRLWLGMAAGSFLAATVAWGFLVLPQVGPRQ